MIPTPITTRNPQPLKYAVVHPGDSVLQATFTMYDDACSWLRILKSGGGPHELWRYNQVTKMYFQLEQPTLE